MLLALFLAPAASGAAMADRMDLAPLPKDPIAAAAFGRSHNDCEQLRQPVVQRIDLDGDRQFDAIVSDRSQCYRKFGGYFAILTQAHGRWISLAYEVGRPHWLRQRTRGWPDFELRDVSRKNCFNLFRLVGTTYVHDYVHETRPDQCRVRERSNAEALQPVRR